MSFVSLTSSFWLFLENYVYYLPPPTPRTRPKDKPMQVICVGPPRSATESLQHALLKLGYDHTYHGWDIMFEQPHNMHGWSALARRKFLGSPDGDCNITAADFDAILGHAVAVCDAPASVFAAEMIQAYPDAKVILNTNPDLDRWHASAMKNIVGVNCNWLFWFMSWTSKDLFWVWHTAERLLWPGLFRCMDIPGLPGNLSVGIGRNGKWIYREHCAMVRGMVEKERLLEWNVQDGWKPLCEFLGKEVPIEEFPKVNDAAGFKGREKQAMQLWFTQAFWNIGKVASVIVVCFGMLIWLWRN